MTDGDRGGTLSSVETKGRKSGEEVHGGAVCLNGRVDIDQSFRGLKQASTRRTKIGFGEGAREVYSNGCGCLRSRGRPAPSTNGSSPMRRAPSSHQ
jgi:hypothetical protein